MSTFIITFCVSTVVGNFHWICWFLRYELKFTHQNCLCTLYHYQLQHSSTSLCSTLGQGLETSTFPGESIFSIALAILGLILFALLIGNMQVIHVNTDNDDCITVLCSNFFFLSLPTNITQTLKKKYNALTLLFLLNFLVCEFPLLSSNLLFILEWISEVSSGMDLSI